jgi:hypothetical protein
VTCNDGLSVCDCVCHTECVKCALLYAAPLQACCAGPVSTWVVHMAWRHTRHLLHCQGWCSLQLTQTTWSLKQVGTHVCRGRAAAGQAVQD